MTPRFSRRASASARRALPWLAALVAAGCASSTPPEPEELRAELVNSPVPGEFVAPGLAGPVQGNWLATFADESLNSLVQEALAYNADLRGAAARVARAAAYVEAAGGTLWPTVDAIGRAGGEMGGDASGLEGGMVTASWELDVWGRVRYQRRGVEDQYASAEADFTYARESLVAMVAKSWFLATETQIQRQYLIEMVDAATNLLALAEDRQRIGIGNELDVASARISLQTYRDGLRQVELAREQALRALELLVGRYPAAQIAVPEQFASLDAGVPVGLPSELLERRPDMIAAQMRVAAAFNMVQEAEAARLPRFALTGSVSSISSDLFVLTDRDNPVWSLGGSVFAPLFQGGALRAQVELRNAEQEEAIAAYVQTALTAFGDVENALSSEFTLEAREAILGSAVVDAARALELAETRYRVGSGDLRGVEQQQLTYHSTRMTLLRVQSERRVQRVNLHLALGGGFSAS
ncbi:MAG TPA: efflux transporter outer membrane subunit [Gammaproteobacteria bacterium]